MEFPGGKIENDESISDAIIREIKEELKCKIIDGTPIANEHDKLIWMHKQNLQSLKWTPADIPAVKLLIKES